MRERRRFRSLTGIVLAVTLVTACTTTADRTELATEYYNLGNAFLELGDLERSAVYFSRALELDESLARASYNLARVYVLQNRYQDAIDILLGLRAEDETNTVVLETLGYAYYSLGDSTTAGGFYQDVLDIDPANGNALYNLARIERDTGNLATALDLLERAVELNPDDTEALALLATVAGESGDSERATASLELLRESGSAPPESMLALADLYRDAERYDKALEVLDELVSRSDARAVLPVAQFDRAFILLTAAEEPASGLAALQDALTAGFSDQERIAELVGHPSLTARSQVLETLDAYSVSPDSARDQDAGQDDSQPAEDGAPERQPPDDSPRDGDQTN